MDRFFSWTIQVIKKNTTKNSSTKNIEYTDSIRLDKCQNVSDGIEIYMGERYLGKSDQDDIFEKRRIVGRIPPIAIFHLAFRKQYVSLNDSQFSTYKYVEHFEIEEEFPWGNYPTHKLYAVICHTGQETESGHDTCYIKHNGIWFHHDDEITEKVEFRDVQKSASGYNRTSYSVVYVQEDFSYE